MIQASLKQVSSKFQESFTEVSSVFQGRFKGLSMLFHGYFKEVKEVSRVFRTSFKEIFKGGFKHINSLSNKVCFVVVVCQSSQLPDQKEGLFCETFPYPLVVLVTGGGRGVRWV